MIIFRQGENKMKIDTSKTKRIMPCGMLYTSTGQTYFLLHNKPIDKVMWQMDNQQMFLTVPTTPIDTRYEKGSDEGSVKREPIFSYPRHIVTSFPTIEYKYHIDTILVVDIGDDDVSNTPAPSEVEEMDTKANFYEKEDGFQYK